MRVTVISMATIMTCFMMTPLALRAQAPPVSNGALTINDVNFQTSSGQAKVGHETDGIVISISAPQGFDAKVFLNSIQNDPDNPGTSFYSVSKKQLIAVGEHLPKSFIFWPADNSTPREKWWTNNKDKNTNAHLAKLTSDAPVSGSTSLKFRFSNTMPDGSVLPPGKWRIVFDNTNGEVE